MKHFIALQESLLSNTGYIKRLRVEFYKEKPESELIKKLVKECITEGDMMLLLIRTINS